MIQNPLKGWRILLFFTVIVISGCAISPPQPQHRPSLNNEEERLLGEIMDMLDTTIVDAEKKIGEKSDPTSPLKDFTEKLNQKREYLRQVEAGEADYNPELVARYADEVKEIQLHIQNPVERVLESDVFFELGKYEIDDLSEEGKEILRGFAREIMDLLLKKQKELFPDRTFIITIRTIGYADEVYPGPELTDSLMQGTDGSLPEDRILRRQELNRELSTLRAQAINDFIRMELRAYQNDPQVKIGAPEIVGMGEEFPYLPDTVSPPYQSKDKRRRICKVHGKVFRE